MKRISLILLASFFLMAHSFVTTYVTAIAGPLTPELGIYGEPKKGKVVKKEKPEQIKPLKDIMVYCNTKSFVNKMIKDYHMQQAAKGLVNDEKHKDLLESQLWMNPINNQWAIVFVYKDIDRSCIIGGNDIKLYSP